MRIQISKETQDFSPKHGSGFSYYIKAYFCPECGTELYGFWQTEKRGLLSDRAEKEKNRISRLDICPICGGILSHSSIENGYCNYPEDVCPRQDSYASLDKTSIVNGLTFDWMDHYRSETEKENAKALVERNLKKWDVPISESTPPLALEVKNSPEKLKEYISQLIVLEANVYTFSQRLESLYFQQVQIKRNVVHEAASVGTIYRDALSQAEEHLQLVMNAEVVVPRVMYPPEPTPPILAKPGFFNKAKVLAANAELTKQFEEQMIAYHKRIADCRAEEARLKEETTANAKKAVEEAEVAVIKAKDALKKVQADAQSLDTPAKALYSSVENEIAEVEKLLEETLKSRNELYSYNIVFNKYRNLVALSTFYEYLMAERCNSLQGANGAYNIYENEIRANLIISQLSTVIEKLEEIKQSQYMVFSKLQTINEELASLNGKMDKAVEALESIEHNTELVAYNTARTAYYAKKNAELTNSLGYMVAFK